MGAGDLRVGTKSGVRIAVALAPRAAIVRIGVIISVRIVAFDIGKIEQDFVVFPDKISNLSNCSDIVIH